MPSDAGSASIIAAAGELGLYDATTLGIAVVSLVVAVASALLAYQRREIVEGIDSKNMLLVPGASGAIEVRHGGVLLTEPCVVDYRLRCHGRSDIRSEDFDQALPIVVTFARPIVADLTPSPQISSVVVAGELHVGPTLLARGNSYVFTLLFDGDPQLPTVADHLVDTRVTGRDVRQRGYLRRTVYAYLVTAACAAVALLLYLGVLGEPNTTASLILLTSAFGPLLLGFVFATRQP